MFDLFIENHVELILLLKNSKYNSKWNQENLCKLAQQTKTKISFSIGEPSKLIVPRLTLI